jgi:formylglycine-generating enzyme required for sulfatase activity
MGMRPVYFVVLLCLACGSTQTKTANRDLLAPESRRADQQMLLVEAGPYRSGSTEEERTQAYQDFLATSGNDSARKYNWFEREPEAHDKVLPAYRFDLHPVTQAAYAEFVAASGIPAPTINEADWKAQGFIQDYATEVRRYNWTGARPPEGREQHPVVLVPWERARAYCRWRGEVVGQPRRLPSADEFEKAARGPDSDIYPWGSDYDISKLNSGDGGLRDTTAVGTYPQGNSAIGAQDVAGNVFQWTSTPWPHGRNRMTVKGSAWDDHGGLGRAAAAHGRPAQVRHAIVGFRCAADG